MPRPLTLPARARSGLRRRPLFPVAALAAARTAALRRAIQMLETVFDRIGLHVGGHFVHEAFMCESVLQSLGRPQRAGEERRKDAMR